MPVTSRPIKSVLDRVVVAVEIDMPGLLDGLSGEGVVWPVVTDLMPVHQAILDAVDDTLDDTLAQDQP
jgi:hypothetical protein